MWKTKRQKEKDQFERALLEMLPAAMQVSEKWTVYSETFIFKDTVPLHEQVRLFSIPLAEFFRNSYPNISKTDPFVYLATLLIGIYLAKTTPIPELLKVSEYIEQDLGVNGISEMLSRFIDGTPNR